MYMQSSIYNNFIHGIPLNTKLLYRYMKYDTRCIAKPMGENSEIERETVACWRRTERIQQRKLKAGDGDYR